jgi:hypothetical protein
MGGILVSFLHLILYCACVIFIAVSIVWAWNMFIGPIDPAVYKWGRIIVGLLCVIAIVVWLLSIVGLGGSPTYFPGYQR